LTGAGDSRVPTWVFARESTTLHVRRLPELTLHIESSEGHERSFTFDDLSQLSAFHCDFEQHLIATGWSLVEFGPERRSGRDRRATTRATGERRRPSSLKPER
jgi:hypothetical protein